jgi:hypothetical protein
VQPVALIALTSFVIVEAAAAEGVKWRIRSLDASVQALLADGYRRSPTLRRLAADVARTDGIVYFLAEPCPVRTLRACLLHTIRDTGDFRYLWIRIKPDEPADEMMASVAHELQHALEVLSQKWIRSRWDMLTFYRSAAAGASGSTPIGRVFTSYETTAAIDITGKVRSELAAAANGDGGDGAP